MGSGIKNTFLGKLVCLSLSTHTFFNIWEAGRDKHSGLLWKFVSYGRKSFIRLAPGAIAEVIPETLRIAKDNII